MGELYTIWHTDNNEYKRACGWSDWRVTAGGSRLVSEVRAEQADRLYGQLTAAVSPETIRSLEQLLEVRVTRTRVSELERLRTGPTRVSVPEILRPGRAACAIA